MLGKLIIFILLLGLVVLFIGTNLEYRSDIRVWFGDKGLLQEVPIVVSFFVMYLAGVISVLPFVIAHGVRVAGKNASTKGNAKKGQESIKKEATDTDKQDNGDKKKLGSRWK